MFICSFNGFSRFIVYVVLYGHKNEGRSVIDNGFANREEMRCLIKVSKQEMVSSIRDRPHCIISK